MRTRGTDLGLEEQADLLHEDARGPVPVAPRGGGQPAQSVDKDGQLLPFVLGGGD